MDINQDLHLVWLGGFWTVQLKGARFCRIPIWMTPFTGYIMHSLAQCPCLLNPLHFQRITFWSPEPTGLLKVMQIPHGGVQAVICPLSASQSFWPKLLLETMKLEKRTFAIVVWIMDSVPSAGHEIAMFWFISYYLLLLSTSSCTGVVGMTSAFSLSHCCPQGYQHSGGCLSHQVAKLCCLLSLPCRPSPLWPAVSCQFSFWLLFFAFDAALFL